MTLQKEGKLEIFNDELIKVIDEIMAERPELFKELAKR